MLVAEGVAEGTLAVLLTAADDALEGGAEIETTLLGADDDDDGGGAEDDVGAAEELGGGLPQDILEKPIDEEDNMRMLLDLNGGRCEVVTGVTVGASLSSHAIVHMECSIGS